MIFSRGKKKQQDKPQYTMNNGVIKLAAALLIFYVIATDYQQGNRSFIPGQKGLPVVEDPAAQAEQKVPGADKIVQELNAPEKKDAPHPKIKKDPKLEVTMLQPGKPNSPVASYSDTVLVKYTGVLADQTVFADTHETPASFVLGDGSVIPGLEQGIAGMQEGEVRQLIVPPSLGYNLPFHNEKVPAGTEIAFIVRLIDVQRGSGKIEAMMPFRALDMAVGEGAAVKEGDKVSTRYTIYNAHGMQLAKNDTPHGFVLGESKTPQDYAEGIAGMKPGGKRVMIIPPVILRDLTTELPKYQLLHIEVELVAAGDTVELAPEVDPMVRPKETHEATVEIVEPETPAEKPAAEEKPADVQSKP